MVFLESALLISVVLCALVAPFCKKSTTMVGVYLGFSLLLALVWAFLGNADIAIVEAAVGTGVSGLFFLVALRRLRKGGKDA